MSKFCGKCGTSIPDSVAFCPECGEKSVAVEANTYVKCSSKLSGKAKKIIIAVALVIVVVIGMFSFSSAVNEPCDWCGHSPSVKYKTSDGELAYVCKDCSKECTWCGAKATKHYENLFGMIVFVCNDCYEEAAG